MNPGWKRGLPNGEDGGTLLVALVTITTLSIVAGSFVLEVTSRGQVAARSASWHTAALTAESAADLALAEIRRVMSESVVTPPNAWTGWTSSTGVLPTGKKLTAGMVLKLNAPVLQLGGEEAAGTSALVTIDAPSNLVYPSGSSYQWLRIRAVGTALLPSRRDAGLTKIDSALHHFAFRRERADITGRGSRDVPRPQVSRAIEVIVQPVLPFRDAVLSRGAINVTNTQAVVDSFDSSDPAKSTSGLYDSNKRQQKGSVYSLAENFTFAGTIHGDAGTNGGTLVKTSSIAGNVSNNVSENKPLIQAPTGFNYISGLTSLLPNANLNLTPSTSAAAPTRILLNSLAGDINVDADPDEPRYVEIYVSGDITGKITAQRGAHVTVYFGGDLDLNASKFNNKNQRASHMQFYGVKSASNTDPTITARLSGRDVYASIYAPEHAMSVSVGGHIMGALVVKSLNSSAALHLHYDELLATSAGKIVDYKVAHWIEHVR